MPDPTYDAIDRLVDEGPIALRDLAWRLMRERDEARARANEAARLSAEARDQADDLRRLIAGLREEIAIIDESRTDMTVVQIQLERERDEYRAESERLGVMARHLVDRATAFRGERDAMRSVADAQHTSRAALIAAVEQMEARTVTTLAPNGCDDCSVEPGDLHRYEGCPGAERQRARDLAAELNPAGGAS